nr:alcohol dehydrogenase catalytic domain-containing protein [Planococcus sp. ISL-110]
MGWFCGSDLHEHQERPVFVPTEKEDQLTGQVASLIMGHEFAGVIEKVGAQATKFKVGGTVLPRLPERFHLSPRASLPQAATVSFSCPDV